MNLTSINLILLSQYYLHFNQTYRRLVVIIGIVAGDFTRKVVTHSGMQMSFTINKSIKTDFD